MALNYPGEAYVAARRYQMEQEKKANPWKWLGEGISTGIEQGQKSAIEQASEKRKFDRENIQNLLKEYTPVQLVNPEGKTWSEKYKPVPVSQYPAIAEAMYAKKAVPAGIEFSKGLAQKIYRMSEKTGKMELAGEVEPGSKILEYGMAERSGSGGQSEFDRRLAMLEKQRDNYFNMANSKFTTPEDVTLYTTKVKQIDEAIAQATQAGSFAGISLPELESYEQTPEFKGLGFLQKNRPAVYGVRERGSQQPWAQQGQAAGGGAGGGKSQYTIGQIINVGGKKYKITGLTDPTNPDIEEVR